MSGSRSKAPKGVRPVLIFGVAVLFYAFRIAREKPCKNTGASQGHRGKNFQIIAFDDDFTLGKTLRTCNIFKKFPTHFTEILAGFAIVENLTKFGINYVLLAESSHIFPP